MIYLPRTIEDGELEKFRIEPNGDTSVAVNVVNSLSNAVPVYVVDETISTSVIKNFFTENVLAPPSVETLIASYTVPVGKSAKLLRVEFGGENYGIFSIYKNSVKIGLRRTWWTGFSDVFQFSGGTADGFPLTAGDVVDLKIYHERPGTVNFEGRIQVVES